VESTPLISVVTPFYNTDEYLAECIESVLRQTYTNWEYILVNNRSTDRSAEIAQQYAARFPGKIRLVHTDSFLNQVQNYNFALSLISPDSKYCKMVQADDWIFPDCLRSMMEVGEQHPTVGIIAAYELEGDHASLNGLPYPSREVPGYHIGRLFFEKHMPLFGTPTSLLMRSELVRSRTPFYDERYAPFEDSHVCFDLLRTWNYGFVHQVLTYSRRDNESILARIRPYRFELFTRLSKIIAHGNYYLSSEEYPAYLKNAENEYFFFLGRSALQGKGADFWAFHRKRLASINYNVNFAFMSKWIFLVLLDDIGNPKRTLEYLWPRRTRLFSAFSRFIGTLRRIFLGKHTAEGSEKWQSVHSIPKNKPHADRAK
jgi:glycosyltransferase involved in cell wall biosynthesis